MDVMSAPVTAIHGTNASELSLQIHEHNAAICLLHSLLILVSWFSYILLLTRSYNYNNNNNKLTKKRCSSWLILCLFKYKVHSKHTKLAKHYSRTY